MNVRKNAIMTCNSSEITRRTCLGGMALGAAAVATDAAAICPVDPLAVCNVTHLYSVTQAHIVAVRNADDIRLALQRWPGRVSVGGGRYSMGGQTALAGGMQLDMRAMQQVVHFDPVQKTVRVQAGMRWRALQALIDPYDLAVRTMQSYANFTVGGSVSVNCHGRYVGHGPIVSSVRALQLVMPDGEVLEATPDHHAELFAAAIGGYGGVGVVTEVELALDDNFAITKHVERVALEDYPAWFKHTVASDPSALLHNTDLQPALFDQPHCVTWRRTDKAVTQPARLHGTNARYWKEKTAIWAMTELPGGDVLRRKLVNPVQDQPAIVWRNYEASRDVAELEPATRAIATYVLQEYFIPERHFAGFARQMGTLVRQASTGTLNVSVRHAPADRTSLMAWAQEDVFSFVVYYKQRVHPSVQQAVADWTRAMVALALAHGGTYYLPYQLHATQQQFDAAYPQAAAFRTLRQNIGGRRFSNALWDRYRV
jgi:FAD/FMN-containing dehydrogenase